MSFDVNNVVDGNLVICMRICLIGICEFDCIMWWKVDFGWVYIIYSINIMFKSYDGYGRKVCNYWLIFN